MRLPRARAVLVIAIALGGCALLPSRPPDPLTAEEHNDLGVAYYARGDYVLAVREFRRAAARRAGWSRALTNLGDAHLALGEIDAAIDAYAAGLRASPTDPAAANNLAWALLQHPARWRDAEPIIRGALARNPQPSGYYLDTLGVVLLRKGEPRAALEAFRAALADTTLRDRTARILILRHAGNALTDLGDAEAGERCRALAQELSLEESALADIGLGAAVC